jgi:predicted N-acetyltransferase YhbS
VNAYPVENPVPTCRIEAESVRDVTARETLLDRAMGPGRRRKSSEKLRRGRKPSEGLAFVARDEMGRVVGTVRLWDVAVERVISPRVGEMSAQPTEGGAVPQTSRFVTPPSALPGISPTRGEIGSCNALLLGPLAVDPSVKSAGIGSALMRVAIAEAARLGHGAILLVGDAPYYARFGFSAEKTDRLAMPGPYEKHRFLALELRDGALDGAAGTLRATGRRAEQAARKLAA